MKKIIYISLAVFIAATSLQSCNKKLKDQVEALDKSVEELKTKNAELESQLSSANTTIDNISSPIGITEALSWTFNGTDDNVVPNVALSKSYTAKLIDESKSSDQYISNYGGGVYRVYIEKKEDFDYDDGAYIDLYVNTNNGTISNVHNSYLYGSHYDAYDNGTTISTNLNSQNADVILSTNTLMVDPVTGFVDLDVNYTDSTGNTFGNIETGNFKFKGKCLVY